MSCSVSGCGLPVVARSLCSSHYARWRRGGSLDKPLGTKTPGGKQCSVADCTRRAVSSGLCTTHLARQRAGTDLTAPVATRLVTNDLLVRLRHYAPAAGPHECWPWMAARVRGYGAISVPGSRIRQAHVVAWELHHGQSLPAGMVVRHRCDNPPCTNPAHLIVGTHADNVADRMERGRDPHNGRGFRHRSAQEVDNIRRLHAEGVNMTELSRRFGCARGTIMRIVKHVTFS